MKILSNKQYYDLTNEPKCIQDTYESNMNTLILDNKDYELKIDSIHNKLVEIILNPSIKKDSIISKLKEIIKFIEKGK